MKANFIFGICAFAVAAGGYYAWKKRPRDNACKPMVIACRSAGFRFDSANRAQALQECLFPILKTGTFNDVSYDDTAIRKCRKLQKRKKKRGNS